MKKSRHVRVIITSAIAIALFAFIASCGGGGDGGAAGESGSITLTTDTDTILADGSSSATVTALVLDSAGNPVRNFTDVTFSTTLGHFMGSVTSITIKTQPPLVDGKPDFKADPTGIAKVALMSGTTPGVAKVTVSSNSVTNLVRITFTHAGNTGVPVGEAFSLAATYVNISGLWVASLADTITASVGDVYGNAVRDGTVISFKTYNTGGFFGTDMVPTDVGKASSILYSAGTPTPLQGFVSLTGETEGGSTTRVTALEAAPYPDHNIMYAGTNGGGVYKSTDYGATWLTVSRSTENPKQGQNLIDPYIKGHSAIAVDPDNHNAVYVGTGYLGKGNVYRSLDGGMNWNSNNVEEWNGLYDTTAAVLTVVVDGDDNRATDYPYVWIGTEGRGPLYATDGRTFQPSGGIATSPVFTGSGNGTMSHPVLSYTSKSETWTATCVLTAGTATTPQFSGTGDGSMSVVTTSTTTKTENWTVQYESRTTVGTVTPGTNVGNGNVASITLTEPNAASETWTLTAIDGSTSISTVTGPVTPGAVTGTAITDGTVTGISIKGPAPSETFTLTCITAGATDTFSVVSNVRGSFGTVTADGASWTSASGDVTLAVTETGTFNVGDVFTFTSTMKGTVTGITVTGPEQTEIFTLTCLTVGINGTFSVVSDVRGSFGTATAGTAFTSTGVNLTIGTGTSAYAVGDVFTFTSGIVAGTTFSVQGSVGGSYPNAEVGKAYDEDGLSFLINEGSVPFATGDTFTFTTTTTVGWNVIGTVSGAQTDATTGTAYTSDGGEVGFTIHAGATPFETGDKFTFSTTAGLTYWVVGGTVSGTQTNLAFNDQWYTSDGEEVSFIISEGSVPFANNDKFTFTVTASTLGHGWTVWDMVRVPHTHGATAILYAGTATGVYKTTNGAQTWSSLTLFTGDYAIALELYPTATGGATDIIYAGTQNGGVWVSTNSGSTWTQYAAGMDSGMSATIKDILVDPVNHRLYAIAYKGPTDQAKGDVYVHTLNSDGTMTSSPWTKANTGLSGKALFALAANIPSNPSALFAGGEGINLHMATSGLDTGSPSWQGSKTGLSNTIMARMPVLFSGQCSLDVSQVRSGNVVIFTIYIQDINGNPPISGNSESTTTFKVTYKPKTGTEAVIYDLTYADSYVHRGTFRDPGDASTNIPYRFYVTVSSEDQIVIEYAPANTLPDVPGSSGSPQTLTYTY